MNAKPSLPCQTHQQVDKLDLIDAHSLCAEQMGWLCTLIHVAKNNDLDGKTLLEIAEYLTGEWQAEHGRRANQLKED